MASPPPLGERKWSASPWLPLAYAEVTRTPDTYGVVILGNERRDPILVGHGSIRDELWRFHRSPRTAAQGVVYFRFIATLLEREAELLAVIVRTELSKGTGHEILWKDFPPSPALTLTADAAKDRS